MDNKSKDVISLVLKESKAYTSIDLIESHIASEKSLEHLPVQPLYVIIKSLPIEMKTHALKLLTPKQRQTFYDIDLWKRDGLDVNEFSNWVCAVSQCPEDDIRFEFCNSNQFLLFLKGRFNVWTFDLEEPLYPDHDYYFITEDDQLLFEYDKDCEVLDEVKQLIKDLYSKYGVEYGYKYLFSMIADDFVMFSEDEYRFKKGRLGEFGFVDYYDSLEVLNPFPSHGHIERFIKTKNKGLGEVDVESVVQTLHQNSLIAFENNHDYISNELMKVKTDSRFNYLHLNFVRLVNAVMEYHGVLKDGPVAMTRIGKIVRNYVNLGLDYSLKLRTFDKESGFDYFDFSEFFKIGNSLILTIKKRLKKELAVNQLDDSEDGFVGSSIETFLEDVLSDEVIIRDQKGDPSSVMSTLQWKQLNSQTNTVIGLMPFIKNFKDVYLAIISDGKVHDSYYLNYDTNSIDFEAIIISSFVNFCLKKFEGEHTQKMGITIDELRLFNKDFMDGESFSKDIDKSVKDFCASLGFDTINGIEAFLTKIILDQMTGYDFSNLDDIEFKHVGGPIILNTLS